MGKKIERLLELPAGGEERTDRQFISALARGLEVLRVFEPGDGPLGNQEIAARAKLPTSTISRITHTLTRLGYLEYFPRLEKYALGTPVLALGYAFLSNIGIRNIARPHMQELADYAGASVAAGSRDRLQMTYLELCHGNRTMSLRLDVGSRVPIHRSAMGMAYLHALPENEREILLGAIRVAEGKDWPIAKKRFDAAFKDMEKHGFCISTGIFERTVNGVGAALVSRDGSGVYAFNCSAPAFQLPESRMYEDIGPALVTMMSNIEADLGRARFGI